MVNIQVNLLNIINLWRKPCEQSLEFGRYNQLWELLGFPCGSAGKESACNAFHLQSELQGLGSIPGFGKFPGEGKGYPLQYSGLEN